jgi:hypothetical protein
MRGSVSAPISWLSFFWWDIGGKYDAERLRSGVRRTTLTEIAAVHLGMDQPEPTEQPNLNTDTPWSEWDDADIRWGIDHGRSIEETADLLCSMPSEIQQRIREIEEADAIGDP